MKNTFKQVLFLVLITGTVLSCGKKEHSHHEGSAAGDSDDWAVMDEFHTVMAEAFHPYKDSANLQPAKDHAAHMAAVAERWAEAPLPERVNNERVREKIEQLRDDTKAFEQTVKAEPDEVIGEALNRLHDQFHELQDAWYHSDNGHTGHHH